ncbi:hypothetical protein QJQ45_021769 [Haematococcus lacustris]|nr:hypothetical protein QJQ45_021769 [Haematococcus lacustris]
MRAFSLLLVLLAALVIPEAYAQPVILSTPGLQCVEMSKAELPQQACPANGGVSAQLIDSATPSSACSITVRQGPCPSRSSQTTAMNLVFSDEFAATARNLSGVARDPVWTAHDQHFADTQDQAGYKPDAVSLRACGGAEGCQTPGVLAIRAVAQSSPLPDSFQAAAAGPTRVTGLGFRSGMVSSWNKVGLCYRTGTLAGAVSGYEAGVRW